MIELVTQIRNIEREIESSQANHEHRLAIDTYNSLIDDDRPLLDELRLVKQQREVLEQVLGIDTQPFQAEEQEKRGATVACWQELMQNWQEKDFRVKQDSSHAKFSKAVQAYTDLLRKHNKKVFDTWVREREAEVKVPEAVLEAQKNLPHLQQELSSYKHHLDHFQRLSRRLPDEGAANQLQRSFEAMRGAIDKMEFNLPEAIEQFFRAVMAGGVPLRSFDAEVRQWLDEHGQLDEFVIRRKGQSSW